MFVYTLTERTNCVGTLKNIVCACSSVGRAFVLYTNGPWFESKHAHSVFFNGYNEMVLGSSPSTRTKDFLRHE